MVTVLDMLVTMVDTTVILMAPTLLEQNLPHVSTPLMFPFPVPVNAVTLMPKLKPIPLTFMVDTTDIPDMPVTDTVDITVWADTMVDITVDSMTNLPPVSTPLMFPFPAPNKLSEKNVLKK